MKKPFSFSHLIGYGGKGKPKAAETPAETDDEEDPEETQPEGEPADDEEDDDGEQDPKPAAVTPKPKKPAAAAKPKKGAAEQLAAAVAAAKAEGASEERARCATIFASEHAGGRESLAAHFAFNSELSAEEAVTALAASPKGGRGGKNALASAMSHIEEPALGPTAGGGGDKKPGASLIENAKARAAARKPGK